MSLQSGGRKAAAQTGFATVDRRASAPISLHILCALEAVNLASPSHD